MNINIIPWTLFWFDRSMRILLIATSCVFENLLMDWLYFQSDIVISCALYVLVEFLYLCSEIGTNIEATIIKGAVFVSCPSYFCRSNFIIIEKILSNTK